MTAQDLKDIVRTLRTQAREHLAKSADPRKTRQEADAHWNDYQELMDRAEDLRTGRITP
jgi:hypothetical protein